MGEAVATRSSCLISPSQNSIVRAAALVFRVRRPRRSAVVHFGHGRWHRLVGKRTEFGNDAVGWGHEIDDTQPSFVLLAETVWSEREGEGIPMLMSPLGLAPRKRCP